MAGDVGVVYDTKVDSPVLIDTGLLFIFGFAVLLRPQRRVMQVLKQQERLFLKSFLDRSWRVVVGAIKVSGIEKPHWAASP